jgi:hypothetical protein
MRQTFLFPNANRAPNRRLQEFNFYEPAPPFLAPRTFSQTQRNILAAQPTATVDNSTFGDRKLNPYQPSQSAMAPDTLTHPQRSVEDSSTTPVAVVDNYLLGVPEFEPSYKTSTPVVAPPRCTFVFQKDVHAPESITDQGKLIK